MKKEKYVLKTARTHIPKRSSTSNKTHGGKTLIVAGSKGMWGAAILSSLAASKAGAGYVYLYTEDQKHFPVYKHPDFLTQESLNTKDLLKFKSIAIGPGLSNILSIQKLIKKLLKENISPVVLDAQALNALAKMKLKEKLPLTWVLTPHEGELSRLLQISSTAIRKEREQSLLLAQKKWGGTFLLKGHKTLISDGHKIIEITSGNAALAKAGTGDVLTGMIAANLSQGLKSLEATCFSAFTHGYMADQWIKNKNDILSLMASDLIAELPKTLKHIRSA